MPKVRLVLEVLARKPCQTALSYCPIPRSSSHIQGRGPAPRRYGACNSVGMNAVSPADEDARLDFRSEKDLDYWAKLMDVPKDQLRRAAEQAGPRIGDIRQHLVG